MPVINDETIVDIAYNTSSNSGRKLVRLNSGNLVSAVYSTNSYNLYKWENNNNGGSWSLLYSMSGFTTVQDISIVALGNNVYVLLSNNNDNVAWRLIDGITGAVIFNGNVDAGQTTLGNNSLAINEAGTKLYAGWASKNGALSNSINIRFTEGTINTDGSIAWGIVEQVTTWNTTTKGNQNPSIILKANSPIILSESFDGTSSTQPRQIVSLIKNTIWSEIVIYNGAAYTQYAPSSIFVPQRISGLTNGLMALTWHGVDSTNTTTNYIRFSKAIDGTGATWSTPLKLVPGTNATLTANESGKLFITYEDVGVTKRIESINNGDSWSTAIIVGTGTNPSSLFDLMMNTQVPLTIRKGASSVLFSGSWTATTISSSSGDIGSKSNPSNLLPYSITTDGAMSIVTEKVNGLTVGTKTAISGQALIVSLTDAQWDLVNYGKYATSSGTPNTITIEMGNDIWTYTFTKTANENTTESQLVESIKDMNEVFLPGVKEKLVVPIRSKGGTVPTNPSFDSLVDAITGIQLGKKSVLVSITSAPTTTSIVNSTGGSLSLYYVAFDASLLPFIPSKITLYKTDKSNMQSTVWHKDNFYFTNSTTYANTNWNSNGFRIPYINGVINLPVAANSSGYTLEAIE